jgi:NitT/TauT family transport system substrate-binding protein
MKHLLVAVFVALAGSVWATAASAEETAPLQIGFQQGGSSTLPMLALQEKFFDQAGVGTNFVPFVSSGDGLNALNLDKLDIGASFGTTAPLTFATKGAKFIIIAGNLSGGHPIITKKENAEQFKDIQGFKGKIVGTPRLFTSDVVWRGAIFKAGLVPGRDLTIIEFKRPNDVLEAVKSGKIDVGIGSSSITVQAREAGLAIPLWSNDLFPHHPCCRIVTTQDTIKNRRPDLVKFIKGLLLAEKKFREDPEAAVKADIEQQHFSEKLARELALEPHQEYSVDPNTKGVVEMWEYMKSINYVDSDLDPRSLIDASLYLEALTDLQREEPAPIWDEMQARFKKLN